MLLLVPRAVVGRGCLGITGQDDSRGGGDEGEAVAAEAPAVELGAVVVR